MATQAMIAMAVALLSACVAVPYGNPAIGRQFVYPGIVPAPAPHFAAPAPHFAAPVPAAFHVPPNNLVYYAPPAAANLVAPVPSALRYATVIAPQPARQQFIYYPQVQQGIVPGNIVVYGPRDENQEEGYYQSFLNLVSNFPFFGQNKPAEEASEAEKPSEAKPEKVQAASEGAAVPQTEKEPDKESEVTNAEATRKQDVPQRVVLYNEPQFYGNFASLHRVNPATALPTADKGAVSSFLLLRNFPAPANYKAQPQSPEYNTQADSIRSESSNPNSPVLGYQKFLVLSRQRGLDNFDGIQRDSSSSEQSDESGSEESSADSNSSESGEAEKGEENSSDENGPTIAQVKPHAIAVAGPGGVAAAAPVGTALVGPGGMALSAPSATAVAGAGKGAQPIAVSPAAQKAVKTYSLASKNPSSLIKP